MATLPQRSLIFTRYGIAKKLVIKLFSVYKFDILKETIQASKVPVITEPLYISRKAEKLRERKLQKYQSYVDTYRVDPKKAKLIIGCTNDRRLCHYENQLYPPSKPVPLVTQHWQNKKYAGSVLVIRNTTDKVPSLFDYDGDLCHGSFQELCLNEQIQRILLEHFQRPTNPQLAAIPLIKSGKNLILAAETGSGKTLAYLLPLLEKLANLKNKKGPATVGCPRVLVLLPNSELCDQVFRVSQPYADAVQVCVGRLTSKISAAALLDKANDVIIATPGLLQRHIAEGRLQLRHLRMAILDEADTLLDDSFRHLVTSLLSDVNFSLNDRQWPGCQLVLVSATIPQALDEFLVGLPELASFERVTTSQVQKLQPHITHKFVRVRKSNVVEDMLILAKQEKQSKRSCIVFVNTAKTAMFLSGLLKSLGVSCLALSRGTSGHRDRCTAALDAFHTGRCSLLIATELGSHGLDTLQARHVINFDAPRTLAEYLHRAGRVGRASADKRRNTTPPLVTTFVRDRGDVVMTQIIERAVRLHHGTLTNIFDNIKKTFSEELKRNNAAVAGTDNSDADDDDDATTIFGDESANDETVDFADLTAE